MDQKNRRDQDQEARRPENEGAVVPLEGKPSIGSTPPSQKAGASTWTPIENETVSRVFHEIRTPLNSILILTQLLSVELKDSIAARHLGFLESIQNSSRDILSLLNELLEFARTGNGRTQIVDEEIELVRLAARVHDLFSPLARHKNISFRMVLDEDLPHFLRSDSHRIHQILSNLLSNAIKFTDVGQVTFSITHSVNPGAAGTRQTPVENSSRPVVFEVEDTGVGIPYDELEAIFEPFHQVDGSTSRKFGGTGLGLAISRNLARLLGGDIIVNSSLGEGSTFKLSLPLLISTRSTSSPDSNQILTEAIESDDAPLLLRIDRTQIVDDRWNLDVDDSLLILIVDDSETIETLQAIGHSAGFKVVCAREGDTGLDLCVDLIPDVVITETMLPNMSGWTVLDRLKKIPRVRRSPVVMIGQESQRRQAMARGAFGLVALENKGKQFVTIFQKIARLRKGLSRRVLLIDPDRQVIDVMNFDQVDTLVISAAQDGLYAVPDESIDAVIIHGDPGSDEFSRTLERIRSTHMTKEVPVITLIPLEPGGSGGNTWLRRDKAMTLGVRVVDSVSELKDVLEGFLNRPL